MLLIYCGLKLLVLASKHRELLFEINSLFEVLTRLLLLSPELSLDLFHITFNVLVIDVQRGELGPQCSYLGLGFCLRCWHFGITLCALSSLSSYELLLELFHSLCKPVAGQLRIPKFARELLLMLFGLLLNSL